MNKIENLMDKIISLCKRRGFVFQSSEIYGGFGSCYDFGPLGVEMKNNIKKSWWNEMIKLHENIVGLDASVLMSPEVWKASGHLAAGFSDLLVECKDCHKRFKGDELKEESPKESLPKGVASPPYGASRLPTGQAKIKNSVCPECGGKLTESKLFNLMMKTFVGPVEETASPVYLRAETCQGIYVNFLNVLDSMRLKIPFGICQIGKAFRNEINPGNFIYRIREFEQMELQWFCHPKEADKFFDYWKEERMKWYEKLGVKKENLRLVEVPKEKRAHYAKRQLDIEYKFPFGWKEIEGVHNRGEWDLSNHAKHSGKDLKYFDESTKEKYFPHIIETSVGVDRSFLMFISDAYQEISGGRTKTTEAKKETEVVLKLNKDLAPVKIAILPLVKNKEELVKKAKEVYLTLKPYFASQYDEAGSIGRRYRRQDEIGTIFCITVDFQTLEDNTVTLRDRDTMTQRRVKIEVLKEDIQKILNK